MAGRSCTREMRPTPIAPMLIRLLGAVCPNTLDGTMAGNPVMAAAPSPVFRIDRRERSFSFAIKSRSSGFLQNSRNLLRFENQFGGQQRLLLVLRHMRAVHNIAHELRAERQLHVAAIHVRGLLLVDQE